METRSKKDIRAEVKKHRREATPEQIRENSNAIKCYSNNNFTMVQIENNDIGNGFYMMDYVMEAKV